MQLKQEMDELLKRPIDIGRLPDNVALTLWYRIELEVLKVSVLSPGTSCWAIVDSSTVLKKYLSHSNCFHLV